jgi:hypothetical protein
MPAEFSIRDERDRQRALDFLTGLNVTKPWTLTLAPLRKKRTLSQNALMWKWLDEVAGHISESTGYETEEVHEHLKRKFLTPKRIEIDGEMTEIYSTKNLTTAEMTSYLDAIYRWATADLGLFLPCPEDQGR